MLAVAIAFAQNPEPKELGTRYLPPATPFVFHNNFWVNLHHVLDAESHRREVRAPLKIKLDELPAAERAPWSAALDAYRVHARQNLIFDATLTRITNALTRVASDGPLPVAIDGVDAETQRALVTAAPIYRAHYWAAQRELNDRWIGALQALLDDHQAEMIAAMERVYGVHWPAAPIVVDACADAPPFGGYTIEGPPGTAGHTIIEAANSEYQGDMAFEMLFHEASHTSAIGGPVDQAIHRHASAPPDLFHVVVFYTAGELARRALGKAGDAHYLPYAYRYDLYSRGWQTLRDAVVRDWQPYLDGTMTLDAAIAALVRDTTT